MSESVQANGKCLCGKVEITANTLSTNVGACHCKMCQKWSGGPFLTVDGKQDLSVNGEENITAYNSSEWAQRAFCKHCGTHLYYRLKQTGQTIFSSGLFDTVADLKFDHQIFTDEKPDWYDFANDTHNMTGAEVFAAFNGENQD